MSKRKMVYVSKNLGCLLGGNCLDACIFIFVLTYLDASLTSSQYH